MIPRNAMPSGFGVVVQKNCGLSLRDQGAGQIRSECVGSHDNPEKSVVSRLSAALIMGSRDRIGFV